MFRRCAFHINIANSCTINTGYTESAFNHYRRCNLKSEIHSNKSVKRVKGWSKSPKPKMYFLYFSALFARNSKIYWNKIFLLMFCKPLMKYQALFRSSSLFLCYPLARRQGAHAKCLNSWLMKGRIGWVKENHAQKTNILPSPNLLSFIITNTQLHVESWEPIWASWNYLRYSTCCQTSCIQPWSSSILILGIFDMMA